MTKVNPLAVVLVPVAVLATALAATPARADQNTPYSSLAVQNRKYSITHELTAQIGVLPLDAFSKGLTVGGSYTLHFDEVHAWEIAQFNYSFQFDTDLKSDLAAFDLKPTPFETLDYYVSTNYLFKPLYFKSSALNEDLVYGEMWILLGAGYGWFTRSSRPMVEWGLGFRLYASDLFSFRIDARHLMFMTVDDQTGFDVHNELWIGLGASLSL